MHVPQAPQPQQQFVAAAKAVHQPPVTLPSAQSGVYQTVSYPNPNITNITQMSGTHFGYDEARVRGLISQDTQSPASVRSVGGLSKFSFHIGDGPAIGAPSFVTKVHHHPARGEEDSNP